MNKLIKIIQKNWTGIRILNGKNSYRYWTSILRITAKLYPWSQIFIAGGMASLVRSKQYRNVSSLVRQVAALYIQYHVKQVWMQKNSRK